MVIKNFSVYVAVGIIFLSCTPTKKRVNKTNTLSIMNGVWQYAPLTIDGHDSDWTDPLFFTDKRFPVTYSITNDERNIYIVLKTADELLKCKILCNGILLKLAAIENKKNKVQIHFPLPKDPNADKLYINNAMLNQSLLKNTDLIKVKGNCSGNGLHFRNKMHETGINIQLGTNTNNAMVYEVQVPFSFFYKSVITTRDKNKSISCTINIPGFENINTFALNLLQGDASNKTKSKEPKQKELFAQDIKINKIIHLAVR